MTSLELAFQECIGSCYENVPTPKAISSDLRSTDGLTVLARIEIVAILQHFTHNETQWPTAACRCHFALRDVSCRQRQTPSHPRVPSEWPVPSVDAGSLPFAWITGAATDPIHNLSKGNKILPKILRSVSIRLQMQFHEEFGSIVADAW